MLIVSHIEQVINLLLTVHSFMQVAHHAGCFGNIYATFNNGIVYKYSPGRTLTCSELTDPAIAR